MNYAFCEHSGGNGPWHIRQLSPAGQKLGGGADTPALCGLDLRGGWDLDVTVSKHHLGHACSRCAETYRQRKGLAEPEKASK